MTGRQVAVTGATGFIGSALVPALRGAGHTVRTIGRGAANDFRWDPAAGTIDAAALDGVDAVVNLAGSNIAVRWTEAAKREIVESRTRSTELVARTLATARRGAAGSPVLVSGSAVGFYGDRGDEHLDDASPLGRGFLADAVRQWEASAEPARSAGIRTVHPRVGIVLNPRGGALKKLLLPFRLGLGGRAGPGRQWMSWVALDDVVRAFRFAIEQDSLHGPLNLVAPGPVPNRNFAVTLGSVLGRPAVVPVPAFVLHALFGAMADETLLASQRASPRRLLEEGFRFAHTDLGEALRFELGRGA